MKCSQKNCDAFATRDVVWLGVVKPMCERHALWAVHVAGAMGAFAEARTRSDATPEAYAEHMRKELGIDGR